MTRPVTIAPVIYARIRYTMNAPSVMMTDVADKLGIGITYLSDMLSGWSPLNDEKLAIISDLLDVAHTLAFSTGGFQMNELVTRQQEQGLAISTETKELIQSSIADSTLKRYQRLSKQIEAWLNGSVLTDVLLAEYITELHTEGKSPSTIAAGVEDFISGHSLRVGSTVSLAQAGVSVVNMQNAGRWKSSQMPAHYAKAELAERGAIARFKDGKKVG